MIISSEDGVHKIKVSFDITDQGQNYSAQRNYPIEKIRKLIRSGVVQKFVKDGYAIIMYGHGARHKTQGYFANETNAKTGEEQEPLGKVDSLSIKGKIITYTATLVETPKNRGESVAKLIKNKIGGFSFVMDVNAGIFHGLDYVLSPNFNGNRVVMDSLCAGGECSLGGAIDDEVKAIIGDKEDLFEDAKALLEEQETVIKAETLLEKIEDKEQGYQSKIKELEIEVENQIEFVDHYKKQVEERDTELVELENKHDEELATKDKEIAVLKDSLASLEKSISEEGLQLEDGKVTLDTMAFGSIVKNYSVTLDSVVDEVKLNALSKKKPSKGYGLPVIPRY